MRRLHVIFLIWLAAGMLMSITDFSTKEFNYPEKLSEYGFFEGNMKEQIPAADVFPYALNSPLFSDYAYKLRFLRIPKGQKTAYNPDSVLQFPVGTAIVKTFYYKNDERNDKKGRQLMETRVLLHEAKGWVALPYIWNKEQTEATLEVAGGTQLVAWRDQEGNKKSMEYFVPNMNQCKGCHEKSGKMTPIGPSVRQLNGDFEYQHNLKENQLSHLKNLGLLENLPEKSSEIPKIPAFNDPNASLDLRARGYLDINCAHCHNPAGPARSSGLFLSWGNTNKSAYGFFKAPIAAGRGSGNLAYDIVPGKSHESILAYRMNSADPGIMMPELGRKLIHKEGVALINAWIQSMETK